MSRRCDRERIVPPWPRGENSGGTDMLAVRVYALRFRAERRPAAEPWPMASFDVVAHLRERPRLP